MLKRDMFIILTSWVFRTNTSYLKIGSYSDRHEHTLFSLSRSGQGPVKMENNFFHSKSNSIKNKQTNNQTEKLYKII